MRDIPRSGAANANQGRRRGSAAGCYLVAIVGLLFVGSVTAAPLIPAPPATAATGYIVIDATTGTVIAEQNADDSLPPASLTKIMTSYIAAQELQSGRIAPSDEVPVSVRAWKTGGSRMFIREGTTVPLAEILKGVIIQSGNDASVALAEYIAGTEEAFAALMNQHAARLGLKDTHFENATGLPSETHYTTARDLSELARRLILDHPEHYKLYSQKSFSYNNITQNNRNKLLWRDRYVDGVKTGYTKAAGYCLVASAQRDDMRLISVVLGTRSDDARMRESQKLLAYGFRYFQTATLVKGGQTLHSQPIWGGTNDTLVMGISDDLIATIPRGEIENIERIVDVQRLQWAPIETGQRVGELKVALADQTLVTVPLVALEPVAQANILIRMWHSIYLFFTELFS